MDFAGCVCVDSAESTFDVMEDITLVWRNDQSSSAWEEMLVLGVATGKRV